MDLNVTFDTADAGLPLLWVVWPLLSLMLVLQKVSAAKCTRQ